MEFHWKFNQIRGGCPCPIMFFIDVGADKNATNYPHTSLFIQTGNEIPQNGLEVTLPKLVLGAAYRANLSSKFTLLPEINLDVTFDGKRNVVIKSDPVSIDPKIGFELGYSDFLFLRAGLGNIQEVIDINGGTSTSFQPNLGLGIKLKNLTLDYALTNIGSVGETLYSNVFSLKLSIFKQNKAPVVEKEGNG